MPSIRLNALARQAHHCTATPISTQSASVQTVPYRAKLQFPRLLATNPNLTPAQVRVLLVLWDMAYSSGEAWPKQETLASELGMSRSEVSRALNSAAALGLLQIMRRQRSALYVFPWSPRFGVAVNPHPKRSASRCAPQRTTRCAGFVTSGAPALYSPNEPSEQTNSSSEVRPAACQRATDQPIEPSNVQLIPTELSRECSRVASGPIGESLYRSVVKAAGEDVGLMVSFLKSKKPGSSGGFLRFLVADEWPSWRACKRATIKAAADELTAQRYRDERLASMATCPRCDGTGYRRELRGSDVWAVACGCEMGRVNHSSAEGLARLTGTLGDQ